MLNINIPKKNKTKKSGGDKGMTISIHIQGIC